MRFAILLVAVMLWAGSARADINCGIGDISLVIDSQGHSIKSLKFGNVGAYLVGDSESAVWKLWFVDSACMALNTKPLAPEGQPVYYMTEWEMGNCSISSRDAKLVSHVWDQKAAKLTLSYTHPWADVVVTVVMRKDTIEFSARVTNKSSDPLQLVQLPAGWQIVYGEKEENTFIMPLNTDAVEYKSLKNTAYWMHTAAWEGFIVTSPNKLLGVFNIQEDGKAPLLATENTFSGEGGYPGRVGFRTGTICWRTTGESVDSVRVRIGRYDSLRQYADAYNKANFPNQRKLAQKMSPELREKISGAVLVPTVGKFEEVAEKIEQLPGTAIIHTPEYMRRTAVEPDAYYDPFPNYFPPNPDYGTMDGLKDLISRINKAGHIYMPRTSFFFFAKGSDADLKYGGDNLAMVRADGKPQIAHWANHGWIISPSSKDALDLRYGFFETWKSLGASMYFTNVIGALGPNGHRYDFHPDAPRPDLFWDQTYKLMAWHGYQMPLLSEVGCSRQMPYQAGICTEPSWGPNPEPAHWRMPFRGEFLRYRPEMQSYISHEYLAMYPQNIGPMMQYSIPQVSFSVLHGYQMKHYPMQTRWYRTLALLGQKISKPLYGKRLLGFDRDIVSGVHKANYDGNTVFGNFSHEPYPVQEGKIAPEGFSFRRKDGKLIAGFYSEFNGHRLENPEILIVDSTERSKTKVYAPNADQEITAFLPMKKTSGVKATAHYTDTKKKEIPVAVGKSGVLVKLPVFDAWTGKFIPYVVIESGKSTSTSKTQPVVVQASWAENRKTKLTYTRPSDLPETLKVNVRIENFSESAVTGALKLSGTVIGWQVDRSVKITAAPGASAVSLELPRPSTEGRELIDKMSVKSEGFAPYSVTEALVLECEPLPSALPRSEAEKIAPVVIDWDIASGQAPSGAEFTFSDVADETYGKRLKGNLDSNILVGGPSIQFKKKIYLEAVVKFHKLSDEAETQLVFARGPNPDRRYARSLELRYSSTENCMRWLITSMDSLCDATNRNVQMAPNKWYHIVAYYDKSSLVLQVNGDVVSRAESFDMVSYEGPLQVAAGLDCTLAYLRIGGE